jgi:hypothetical protein
MAPVPVTSERREGPTPNGGAYSEIIYLDDNMNLVDKTEATQAEILEYNDANQVIQRTYGRINRPR